jgi:hypothetical protein
MAQLTASDFPSLTLFLGIVLVVAVVVAAILFSRSGTALRNLGAGRWAIDRDGDRHEDRQPTTGAQAREEIRQMVEARDFRLRSRGEDGIDVEAEVARLTAVERGPDGEIAAWTVEIRQLVIANNERRERRGEPPLDVESEVAKRLEEWA